MTRKCFACGKPEKPMEEELVLANNSFDIKPNDGITYTNLRPYCQVCYDNDREPLWLWFQHIDGGGGVSRPYGTKSWTGSYYNGHELSSLEVMELYKERKT